MHSPRFRQTLQLQSVKLYPLPAPRTAARNVQTLHSHPEDGSCSVFTETLDYLQRSAQRIVESRGRVLVLFDLRHRAMFLSLLVARYLRALLTDTYTLLTNQPRYAERGEGVLLPTFLFLSSFHLLLWRSLSSQVFCVQCIP
jgi:hypothetical protein